MSNPNPASTEPALTVGAVTALAGAVLSLAVAFGLDLSPERTAAIMAVTTVLAPLVSAWFTRARVYSPAAVTRMTDSRAENDRVV